MFLIINGPNLNILGKRQPEIYGHDSFESFLPYLRKSFEGEDIVYIQTNSEGEIIDRIQEAGYDPACKGIVLNPGAYGHYSIAISDAIASIPVPVVEVHISNIHAREEFRQRLITAQSAAGIIAGLGLEGYRYALEWLSKGHV